MTAVRPSAREERAASERREHADGERRERPDGPSGAQGETREPFDLLLAGLSVVAMDDAAPVAAPGDAPGAAPAGRGTSPRVLRDAAIGVRGNRIAYVGPAAGVADHPARERLNLPERLAIPGLVNVHTHAALAMVRGVAEDLGFAPAYTPGVPQGGDLDPDDAVALARLGALEALTFGSTLVNDTYVHAEHTLPAMAELGLRVYASPRIHDADFARLALGAREHRVEIGRRTLDEALALAERWHRPDDPRTGVQLAVHAADTCSEPLLREVAAAARALGLRVTTHLAQSRDEVRRVLARDGRTPAETFDACGLLDDRLIAAHCLFLSDADVARIGRARIHVAHVPRGNALGGAAAPTPALRAAGANLALATDNMHGDMIEAMRWALAVARLALGGVSPEWQPRDVLAMATRHGARAMGLHDELGSLEPGKLADITVVDFRRPHLCPDIDPTGNLVHVAHGRDVELVIVDGRIVVRDGQPTRADAERVRRDAQRAAEAAWRRADARAHRSP